MLLQNKLPDVISSIVLITIRKLFVKLKNVYRGEL